ncbi:hypothetical protein LHJ74_08090 [Streptomyces sp. N2-109]|uniref:Excalibur calcium-binding domain-containing protein n=1 Tax=Streptomyces gossypii TaxID=2883101 RepID=A0ABT2JPR8_9ACTN|nr:hypothetical protein [Streptomyces gossypii]MCT2589873.1 hypothetical protein [Streptomyces gossypii]
MRLRTAVAAGVLAAVTPLSLSTVATAQGDKDCKDHASQKEAQRTFDADTSDPQNIDTDDDQKACETWPPGPGDPSNAGDGGEAPEGSVDAGAGGASQDPANATLPLAIAAGASLAAAGGVLVVRRHLSSEPDS